jgi:hypothetical protein
LGLLRRGTRQSTDNGADFGEHLITVCVYYRFIALNGLNKCCYVNVDLVAVCKRHRQAQRVFHDGRASPLQGRRGVDDSYRAQVGVSGMEKRQDPHHRLLQPPNRLLSYVDPQAS